MNIVHETFEAEVKTMTCTYREPGVLRAGRRSSLNGPLRAQSKAVRLSIL